MEVLGTGEVGQGDHAVHQSGLVMTGQGGHQGVNQILPNEYLLVLGIPRQVGQEYAGLTMQFYVFAVSQDDAH